MRGRGGIYDILKSKRIVVFFFLLLLPLTLIRDPREKKKMDRESLPTCPRRPRRRVARRIDHQPVLRRGCVMMGDPRGKSTNPALARCLQRDDDERRGGLALKVGGVPSGGQKELGTHKNIPITG